MAPNPTITSVTWPSSLKEVGDECETWITYRNDGTDGEVFTRVVDSEENVLATMTSSVAAGEICTDTVRFYMSYHDITIYAQVGIDSTVTSERGPKTIEPEEPGVLAEGSITSYDAPASANSGDTVTSSTKAKNVGTASGSFRLRLEDRDENVYVDSTDWFTLPETASTTKTLTATMPKRDWNLKSILERELPTGEVTIDDTVSYTVVLEEVPPPPPDECPFKRLDGTERLFLCRLWRKWRSWIEVP